MHRTPIEILVLSQSTKLSMATVINSMIYDNSFSGQEMSQIVIITTECPLRNFKPLVDPVILVLLSVNNTVFVTTNLNQAL